MQAVIEERRGSVLILKMNNPPVNGLGAALRAGLAAAITAGQADNQVSAFVVTGEGRMYSAGADIREFGGEPPEGTPDLNAVVNSLEMSSKPVVSAIHGVAAGGGLEVALGTHYRVGAAKTRVGLPEVTLGILPGAGGTQRLPRIIDITKALELITSGRLISVNEAYGLGIIDEIAEGDLVDTAVAAAERLVAEGTAPRRSRDQASGLAAAKDNPGLFEDFAKTLAKAARGMNAPYACVRCIEAAATMDFEDGLNFERSEFAKLVTATEAASMRHAFFAEREVAKIPDVPVGTPAKEIKSAGIIGCGTMGGGIAMNFANAGIPVTIIETEQAALDKGLARIGGNYANTVSKGRLTQEAMDQRMALLTGATDMNAIADADIVIEAVFEDMSVKKAIFTKLDAIAKPGAILATNTSTLDVDEIASVTKRPEDVVGTHFFSPANVMRLMENVRGAKSSPETIATVMNLGKTINKVAVLVGVCDGFVGNRMLHQYGREANFLIEEGALPQQVDKVIFDFGFPMGPFTMGDMAGLDIGWAVRKHKAASRPSNHRYSQVADRICEQGRFGQKTGAGWYNYEQGSRTPIPDPSIEALIVQASEDAGIERREISDDEVLKRCLYPLINEGAKILEEGLAIRASDIDVIWVHGYGFPRYRGGPMFWADTLGLDEVYETMRRYHAEHGELMRPAALLENLAKEGKKFSDFKG
jgi:3-hydroxyacyl-CoA dehydrogenase